MDNVIDLLTAKSKREQEHFDDLVEESEMIERSLEIFSMQCLHDIVELLEEDFGCNVLSDKATIYDILAIIEQIKALAYRSLGEEYPMQTISQTLFESSIEDPESLLNFFMTGEVPDQDG